MTAVREYGAGAVFRFPLASYVKEPASASHVSALVPAASLRELSRLELLG